MSFPYLTSVSNDEITLGKTLSRQEITRKRNNEHRMKRKKQHDCRVSSPGDRKT